MENTAPEANGPASATGNGRSASRARRINRGRGHSYTLDGKPVQGVTTILSKALPKPALTAWAAREVAEFVAGRREILTRLTDQELVDLCKGAPFRERDKAANRGTEVHRLAEKLARGEEVDVPDELMGHVDSYIGFLEHFQPTNVALERPCFNTEWGYGGTLDCLATIPALGGTGLIDVKTNRSGIFGETALQMCAYGRCEFYIAADGSEAPMPELAFYAALWVRADGYDLYPMQVTEREWKTFQHLIHVAWWIDNRSQIVKGNAIWQQQGVQV